MTCDERVGWTGITRDGWRWHGKFASFCIDFPPNQANQLAFAGLFTGPAFRYGHSCSFFFSTSRNILLLVKILRDKWTFCGRLSFLPDFGSLLSCSLFMRSLFVCIDCRSVNLIGFLATLLHVIWSACTTDAFDWLIDWLINTVAVWALIVWLIDRLIDWLISIACSSDWMIFLDTKIFWLVF